jgi:hypothetical protein
VTNSRKVTLKKIGSSNKECQTVLSKFAESIQRFRSLDAPGNVFHHLSKMHDSHMSFLSKDSFKDLSIHIHSSSIGIGVELRDENNVYMVNKLILEGLLNYQGKSRPATKLVRFPREMMASLRIELDSGRTKRSNYSQARKIRSLELNWRSYPGISNLFD